MTRALFEPLSLRGVEIRNRMWVPPMCQYSAENNDGMATDWHLVHYGSLARGGFGLVTVEATGILPEGRITPFCLGLWDDSQISPLKRITDLMHTQGAVASVQLQHAGRKGSTQRWWPGYDDGNVSQSQGGWQPVGPSAIAFPGLVEPTELTKGQIATIVEAFAAGAQRAVHAGFDVVEIHGAHGYLLHQFLSPLSNHREDEFGGCLENRARLMLQVTDAVRSAVGPDVPIVMRVSATEWTEEGAGMDEVVRVCSWIAERGVDLISVSSGGNFAPVSIPIGPGYQVPLAEELRRQTNLPVGVVGMITEPFQAEQIVALGQADVVYVGRQALREPTFPVRVAEALKYKDAFVPPQYSRAY